MTLEITLYEDENIRVYSDGFIKIVRKNNEDIEELMKDMALKYKYTADMFALCMREYNVDIDEFTERCHKFFGFYKYYNKKFILQVNKSLAETEKAGNNDR